MTPRLFHMLCAVSALACLAGIETAAQGTADANLKNLPSCVLLIDLAICTHCLQYSTPYLWREQLSFCHLSRTYRMAMIQSGGQALA